MQDKIIAIISLGLSAASQAFIKHSDTALFFSAVFFVIGIYEFALAEYQRRRQK